MKIREISGLFTLIIVICLSIIQFGCNKEVEKQEQNESPIASFEVYPVVGLITTVFEFDATNCHDNEDPENILQVRWDFNGDNSWDTDWESNKIKTIKFDSIGSYSAKLEVKDSEGASNEKTHFVTVCKGEGPGIYTDPRDGQEYFTVEIGSQRWFSQNLNFETTNSWWYEDSQVNGDKYGRLYTWDDAQIACPDGWHLPTDDEWCTLTTFIDPYVNCNWEGMIGFYAAYYMKSTSGWFLDGNGSNLSGFGALPGGLRNQESNFLNIEKYASFWTATENNTDNAWYWYMYNSNDEVFHSKHFKEIARSVRCVKN